MTNKPANGDPFSATGERVAAAARLARGQVKLWKICAKRLHVNNLMAMSAALSFRTIFALIPTLVLAFLVLKSIGVVEDGKRLLSNFLDTSGISQIAAPQDQPGVGYPAGDANDTDSPNAENSDPNTTVPPANTERATVSVADQIVTLVEDVERQLSFQRLGPIGALLFVWTAMTLLITLESSLNRIFDAPRSRSFGPRVALFWSTITLGPVIIVTASYLGNAAVQTFTRVGGVGWIAATAGWLMPPVVAILVVAAGYRWIPNTHVKAASAFGGALVAVPAWMIARWVFAAYVERFVLGGNLYGVLGLLPLFLLWLNISWSIFLFGAELAHTTTIYARLKDAEEDAGEDVHLLGLSDFLAVTVAVGVRFQRGEGLVNFDDAVARTDLPGVAVRKVIDRLLETGVIFRTAEENPRYGLTRPPEKIAVSEIARLADPRAADKLAKTNRIRKAVAHTHENLQASLDGQSVKELINNSNNT